MLVASIYVRRMGIKATPWREHRLFLACICLANKYLEDEHLSLHCMARIGGVTCAGLMELEKEAIELLDWKLEVSAEEFERIFHSVSMAEKELVRKEQEVASYTEFPWP
jgi:hypothetical protein